MPSRVIRGEILTSDSLSRVSVAAESLFMRLLLVVDDYGRGSSRAALLRDACYPGRAEVTVAQIDGWLRELSTCDADGTGPVQLYAVQGKSYLQLRNWEQHRGKSKRGEKSRHPSPELADAIPADPRGSPRESADPRSGVGGGGSGRWLAGVVVAAEQTAAVAALPPAAAQADLLLVEQQPDPVRKSGRRVRASTPAPDRFTDEQRVHLRVWAQTEEPWAMPQLLALEAACLDHYRAHGKSMKDWLATARGWIRKEAKFAGTPKRTALQQIRGGRARAGDLDGIWDESLLPKGGAS